MRTICRGLFNFISSFFIIIKVQTTRTHPAAGRALLDRMSAGEGARMLPGETTSIFH